MGTLYNQQEREYRNINKNEAGIFFEDMLSLAKQYKLTNQEVISGLKVLELRRQNNLYVNNGDIHDEQMSGIGKELSGVSSSLDAIAESITNKE